MGFKEVHTTSERIAKDNSPDKTEKDKVVLSNDAFAIGELLELLINTTRNK